MKNGSYATYGQENYKKWKRERGWKEKEEREKERKRAFIKINLKCNTATFHIKCFSHVTHNVLK